VRLEIITAEGIRFVRVVGWIGALLLATPIGSVAIAGNVALLIGVGQFADPSLKSQQLLGPEADLDSVQQTLTQRWGFVASDVRVLRDQAATHERILAEISALEQRSARGDNVLIYFSGHGTSANAENNGFDLPYATGAWVPYDVDINTVQSAQRTLIIGRRDLVPRLKRLDENGRAVVVVSDSCYSGQVVRSLGQTNNVTRYLPLPARDLGVSHVNSSSSPGPAARPSPPPYPYQHVLLLSAASDSEQGSDIGSAQALQLSPTLDGRFHGAFTDAFLRLLEGQLLPGSFNYAQAQAAMSAFLEHRHFAQHPQLLPALAEDPLNIGSTDFLGMHLAASPSGAETPVRDAVLHVRLHGVSRELQTKITAVNGVAIVEQGEDLTVRQQGNRVELLGPADDPILTTNASDSNLIRRIAAQVWFNRVMPTGVDRLGLRTETDPGSRGNTYVECETFVFEVRLQKAAYIMVLDMDSQGNLSVLYPTRAAERQIVAPGKPRAIPDEDPKDRIVVRPPFGSDQVAVVAFEEMPAFFTELTDAEHFGTTSSRAAALARGLRVAGDAVSVQQMTVNTYPGSGGAFCAQ
jgi:hypothetical protein